MNEHELFSKSTYEEQTQVAERTVTIAASARLASRVGFSPDLPIVLTNSKEALWQR